MKKKPTPRARMREAFEQAERWAVDARDMALLNIPLDSEHPNRTDVWQAANMVIAWSRRGQRQLARKRRAT